MKNKDYKRDYNKDPIIIEDRIPEITFWFFIAIAFVPLISVLLWMNINNKEIDWIHVLISLSILYFPTFYFLEAKMKKRKKIFFYKNKIEREWDNKKLSIEWDKVKSIKKSFIEFNDKSQKLGEARKAFFSWIVTPFYIIISHPYLILVKFLYKMFKGFSKNELYDTVIIFDTNNEMISVFIENEEVKSEVRKYLSINNYDLDDLSIFYSTSYATDEFTHFLNKKNKQSIKEDKTVKEPIFKKTKNSCNITIDDRQNINFKEIKEKLANQYSVLGFTKTIIDKEKSWMIKNNENEKAYISLSHANNIYKIETFNVSQEPELQI